jgi:putative ABC transport system ATP-binding protein
MLPLSTPSSTHIPPPPAYPLWAFPSQSERPRPLIALDSVSKTYLMGSTHVKALGNISLQIEAGDYCAIMGTSGSGKSTLMQIMGCLDRPTTGTYYLNGENVAQLSMNELARIRRTQIGFVFQQFHLLAQSSALENVMLPMMYADVPHIEQKKRAIAALDRVGLGNRLYNRPNQLSGGQQQRVAIARAIVNHPFVLMADEPTGALDTQTSKEIMGIFADLNASGMTVILVTHDMEVARQTRRMIWLRDGEVIHAALNPAELSEVTVLSQSSHKEYV